MAGTDCFVGVFVLVATSDGRAGVDAGVTLSGSADEEDIGSKCPRYVSIDMRPDLVRYYCLRSWRAPELIDFFFSSTWINVLIVLTKQVS